MRMNEIIDKLHEADFYIYEEGTDLIRFNHNFLNGCNLAMSLDGEINLIMNMISSSLGLREFIKNKTDYLNY